MDQEFNLNGDPVDENGNIIESAPIEENPETPAGVSPGDLPQDDPEFVIVEPLPADEVPVPNVGPEAAEIDGLMNALEDLKDLRESFLKAGGMNQDMALEALEFIPEFNKGTPVAFYTKAPSATQYKAALESIGSKIIEICKKIIQHILKVLAQIKDWFERIFNRGKYKDIRELNADLQKKSLTLENEFNTLIAKYKKLPSIHASKVADLMTEKVNSSLSKLNRYSAEMLAYTPEFNKAQAALAFFTDPEWIKKDQALILEMIQSLGTENSSAKIIEIVPQIKVSPEKMERLKSSYEVLQSALSNSDSVKFNRFDDYARKAIYFLVNTAKDTTFSSHITRNTYWAQSFTTALSGYVEGLNSRINNLKPGSETDDFKLVLRGISEISNSFRFYVSKGAEYQSGKEAVMKFIYKLNADLNELIDKELKV